MNLPGRKRPGPGRGWIALPGLLALILSSGCAVSKPSLPGLPRLPGGFGGGSREVHTDEVCFCKKSQLPVCCDECPQSPACQ